VTDKKKVLRAELEALLAVVKPSFPVPITGNDA